VCKGGSKHNLPHPPSGVGQVTKVSSVVLASAYLLQHKNSNDGAISQKNGINNSNCNAGCSLKEISALHHMIVSNVIWSREQTIIIIQIITQPGLCGDNLFDSLEVSSEESFWPSTWQVLTTIPEQLRNRTATK